MGRPSRKKIASTILFEIPDGNTFYFTINKKGEASLVGKCFSIPQFYVNPNSKLISDSIDKSPIYFNKESYLNENNEKRNIKKEKSSEKYIEMDDFDKFVSCLDYQINIDSILNDNKLSENMLPSI